MSEKYTPAYDHLISLVKWELSKLSGREVGTPETVDFLALLSKGFPSQKLNLPREEIILSYLLSSTHDDRDDPAGSRLRGELIRWEAQRTGSAPREIEPTTMLRDEYAKAHNLEFKL